MATPSIIAKDQASIVLNIFDGSRQPIGPKVKNLLVRIIDGNQKQLFSGFRNGPSFQFEVPFYANFGDRYTVIASADHHSQAGATPVNVQRALPQSVDLMLLDKTVPRDHEICAPKLDPSETGWVLTVRYSG